MIVTTSDKMTNWALYDLPRKHYHICSQVFSQVGIILRLTYLLSWIITHLLLS
jgi:hypothetical protein